MRLLYYKNSDVQYETQKVIRTKLCDEFKFITVTVLLQRAFIKLLITKQNSLLGNFAGTRVPVETLFDHLEAGVSLDDFLEDFPTVSKSQAIAVLETANKFLTSKNIEQLYATVA